MTKRIAGVLLALGLLAALPLASHPVQGAEIPCAAAGAPASGDGCCGDAGPGSACAFDCAAGGTAIPLSGSQPSRGVQRSLPMQTDLADCSSRSAPPETAPPKPS